MAYRILSIDGGGMRGVYPAHFLNCVATKLKINIAEKFDMIAGTSTGAIIAAAIAIDMKPKKIVDLYLESGSKIFQPKKSILPRCLRAAVHSIYNNKSLASLLRQEFGEITLSEIKKPLILPATDIGNGGVHVFKSGYSDNFVRDKDVFLYEALLASCSAPIYFNPTKVSSYLLTDGGLWANNPSLVACTEARKIFNIEFADIKMLSIGTGKKNPTYGVSVNKKWGLITGWKHKELVNFFMSINTQSIANFLKLMLVNGNLLRIDYESDLPLPLDEYRNLGDLISKADKEFSHRAEELKEFFKNQEE